MNQTKRVRFFVLAGLSSFALSVVVGACFNGLDSEGLPCSDDSQCAVGHSCIDGFCNGVFLCTEDAGIEAIFVCDGVPDCPGGEDEAVELCWGGEGQLFECAGGAFVIPSEFLCDGEADCPDGDDEIGCTGLDANECGGGGPDIAYASAAKVSVPVMDPLPVVAVDLLGSPNAEAITGSVGAAQLEVVSFAEDGSASMMAPLGPFMSGTVIDFDLGDVNGDNRLDVVVATSSGEGFTAHVFQNFAPDPPEAYGTPLTVQLPGALVPDVQAIELARLNNDSSIDLVAIVDGNDIIGKGRLMVANGNSATANMGGSYFDPQLLDGVGPLNYETFFDSAAGNFVDDSPLDDIVITGLFAGAPTMWVVVRTSEADGAWSGPFEVPGLMIAPAQIAVGAFTKVMGPDLAVLDPIQQRVQAIRTQGGMLVAGPVFDIAEAMPQGLTLTDINCDDRDDFLVYQDQVVSVYLGDGTGGIYSSDPVRAVLDGAGRGRIAVGEYNGDGTPDLITTQSGGVQIVMSTGESPLRSQQGE